MPTLHCTQLLFLRGLKLRSRRRGRDGQRFMITKSLTETHAVCFARRRMINAVRLALVVETAAGLRPMKVAMNLLLRFKSNVTELS